MSQNNPQADQSARLAGLVGQIGCVTALASIAIIGLAFVIGRFLDSLLGTEWVFTILFLLGGFPVTVYVIVRISLWALARAQRSMAGNQAASTEEKTTTEE